MQGGMNDELIDERQEASMSHIGLSAQQSLQTSHEHHASMTDLPQLLRNMLPDGWDCPENNEHGIQSDGLYLRNSHGQNNPGNAMLMVRANKSIKVSSLIGIVHNMGENAIHSMTLPPASLSRQSLTYADSDLECYVYYFEVFVMYGSLSIGFDVVDNSQRSRVGGIEVNQGPGLVPESIGLLVEGDLWVGGALAPGWTFPFRNGDTIGCGIVIGTNAKYFFTRNGDVIDERNVDFRVPSIHTSLIPCLGLSSTTDIVIRTNFGFRLEQPFSWKGSEKIQFISHGVTSLPNESTQTNGALLVDNNIPTEVIHAIGPRDIYDRNDNAAHSSSLVAGPVDDENLDDLTASGLDLNGHDQSPSYDYAPATTIMPELNEQKLDEARSFDLNDIRDLARELRGATSASDAHKDALGSLVALIDVCRSNLEQINATVQRVTMGMAGFDDHDLGELLAANEMVTDAIEAAEKKRFDIESQSQEKSAREKTDIYSLLCHLRSTHKQKRLTAAWGLLRLTAKGTHDEMCREIIASGGVQSLLNLFEQSSDSRELMMVSALTIVYLLPSFLDSDTHSSTHIHQGVIDCLQLLVQSSGEDADIDIPSHEIRAAAAFAMTNLWFKVFVTKLRHADETLTNDSIRRFSGDSTDIDIAFCRRRCSRRQSNASIKYSGDDVDGIFLIDAFTSVSIAAAKYEAFRQHEQAHDMNVYYEFALIVESICAWEYVRPILMKEGVLKLLLQWLQSSDGDLERASANGLRNLTLTQDHYTAGWIHCQLLNENACGLLNKKLESADPRVRLAMAETISSLTAAPQTRAAIIEARGVKYLCQLLGSVDIQAQEEALALAAGHALLRLAVGEGNQAATKKSIIDDIIENGALTSLVAMTKIENYEGLRLLSAQILCVIISEGNGKEKQLLDEDAVLALGNILLNDINLIRSSLEMRGTVFVQNALKEVRHVLCGLANIMYYPSSLIMKYPHSASFQDTQFRACSQLIKSGGVKSLLWVALMTADVISQLETVTTSEPSFCQDIQVDSWQILASLCPLLLSQKGLASGSSKWASLVLLGLVNVLKTQTLLDLIPGVYVDMLRGLCFLASCEALKMRIIDELLPHLLELRLHGDQRVADAATQVCLALGFNEVISGVNDAYLLGDKFILTRSKLIHAMARDAIRQTLKEVWSSPLRAAGADNDLSSLFPALCHDNDTVGVREQIRRQYLDLEWTRANDNNSIPPPPQLHSSTSLYIPRQRTMFRSGSYVDEDAGFGIAIKPTDQTRATSLELSNGTREDFNISALSALFGNENVTTTKSQDHVLANHQYPLNGWAVEKDWVIEHTEDLKKEHLINTQLSPFFSSGVNELLRVCFPSALIQAIVIPYRDFQPNAHFNFRTLAMPSGRYFSFRREGQLISQELGSLHQPERAHYVLNFRNSSFAGEFTENLLKALYLCPLIQGLTFSTDAFADKSALGHSGSDLLPFLVGAIPASITHLTFDNALSNHAARSLSQMLKNIYEEGGDDERVGSTSVKGSIHALAIINSPHISSSVYMSILGSLNCHSASLQFLKSLDLSGNRLGDACSARVLSIALSSSSHITNLDLSRNDIGEGPEMKRVVEGCLSCEPRLEILNISGNNLGDFGGGLAPQLAASFGDVLSKLVSCDLSANNLTDAFLAALGGTLRLNNNLVNLNISNNKFSSSGTNSFISRLQNMNNAIGLTPLSFIDLEGNDCLASDQESALKEILAANRHKLVATHLKNQMNSDADTNTSSGLSNITGSGGLSSDRKMPPPDTITVLFSAPLVWRDGENAYHPIEMLDFKLEKSLLWQCLSEASRNIDITFDNATTDRLQAVMTRGCKFLHFSGHGHPYSLTFEDGFGGIHWFTVDQLKALLSGGVANEPPFQFVFVSACHSALAGKTFAELGVPHVVCCQQEAQLMDSSALIFSRAFYLALAFGRTLKDSFDIGKHAVLSSALILNPEEEMAKFILLPEDGNHDVPIFNAIQVPDWPLPGRPRPSKNDSLPSPPQGFLGRSADLYHILNLVTKRRFVNITAPTGMGRSSLASALCHYIFDRKSTLLFDDIYFVKSMLQRPSDTNSSPIISLHDKLALAGKVRTKKDIDEYITEILTSLKHTKSLLVFDKIESLGTAEEQDFHFFLRQIFSQTEDVSVLVTSNESMGLSSLDNVGESVYNLGPLDFRNTVKLFAFHCPHLHSARERKELVEGLAPRAAKERSEWQSIKSNLGGGIPAKTFAVAYEMSEEDFEALKLIARKGTKEENVGGTNTSEQEHGGE